MATKGRETAGSLFTLTERDRNRESKTERKIGEGGEDCFEALALEVFPCSVTIYCLHSDQIPLLQGMSSATATLGQRA